MTKFIVLLIIVIILAVLFCTIFAIWTRRHIEKKYMAYQDQIVDRQFSEVRDIYHTMRGWRHDYHNHLQIMKAYLEMNEYDKMKKYLNLLEQDLNGIKIKYNSGNANLDAILNGKLSLAEKEAIRIRCKTEIGGDISVEDTDLCKLIGNLIDNAVEACRNIEEEEKRFLRIYICTRRSQLYISVTNATKELVRKLDHEYITQKRGNHGHGLKRINQVVEKYGGYIKRANEPGVFTTEIMLPLFDAKKAD